MSFEINIFFTNVFLYHKQNSAWHSFVDRFLFICSSHYPLMLILKHF